MNFSSPVASLDLEFTHNCFAWVPVCSADRSRDLRSSGMLHIVDW